MNVGAALEFPKPSRTNFQAFAKLFTFLICSLFMVTKIQETDVYNRR